MYHRSMEPGFCSTPGHETKQQHGQTGLCQACYRRKRREERGLQKPGRKPDPTKPFSRSNPASKHYAGGSVQCANGHRWTKGSFTTRKDGRKICLWCIEVRKGAYCPAGLHVREGNMNKHGQCTKCAPSKQAAYRLLNKYKLTPEKLEIMLEACNRKCTICKADFNLDKPYPFAVDHDHSCCPGEITCGACLRSLLCQECNNGLGKFKDDPVLLQAAADYLLSYT